MEERDNLLYKRAQEHLMESARVKRRLAGLEADFGVSKPAVAAVAGAIPRLSPLITPMVDAARTIADAFRRGGKLLLCGNGGSAADCQHMAAEFVSRLAKDFDRPAMPAIALTTDTSFLTAFANDEGFNGVFARQIQALGKRGDVLLAISTSGESPNIIQAVQAAKAGGVRVVALSGPAGRLKDIADIAIAVPSKSVHHTQEAHLAIEHVICDLVEHILFKKTVVQQEEAV